MPMSPDIAPHITRRNRAACSLGRVVFLLCQLHFRQCPDYLSYFSHGPLPELCGSFQVVPFLFTLFYSYSRSLLSGFSSQTFFIPLRERLFFSPLKHDVADVVADFDLRALRPAKAPDDRLGDDDGDFLFADFDDFGDVALRAFFFFISIFIVHMSNVGDRNRTCTAFEAGGF